MLKLYEEIDLTTSWRVVKCRLPEKVNSTAIPEMEYELQHHPGSSPRISTRKKTLKITICSRNQLVG
ncbi:hypothetical protein ACN42_g1126 [Penicillium freii]|uniref:Uncharacterized protein n=1 Tax=Penicillium freii TaxID=48697 RepID=A0A124GSY9_PENFR|nr:hypothetical protein ACN42_g1126 [Penicillium freii]